MKLTTGLMILGLVALPQLTTADVLLLEDFEDNTLTFTASDGLFTDGAADYFTIVPLNGAALPSDGAYTGFDGNNFFAAEDIDDGGTRPGTQTLSFSIDITGFESLTFSGLFGAGGNDATGPAYDDEESVLVRATIDGGTAQNLLAFEAFEPGGDTTNNQVAIDADFNGIGDAGGFLPTSALTLFDGLAIAGTGTDLLLEIVVTSTDGNSEFAFDNVQIEGTLVPEPSALMLASAAVGLVVSRRRRV